MVYSEIMQMGLIDHHAHGVSLEDFDVQKMGDSLNESSSPILGGSKAFEKPVGLNIRGFCGPVLDLPAHQSIDQYLARRQELGGVECSRRLIESCNLDAALLDTYNRTRTDLTTPTQFQSQFGVTAYEVLRVESIFENVAMRLGGAQGLMGVFEDELANLAPHAVGLKSILAYRTGFCIDHTDPLDVEVERALDEWFMASASASEGSGSLRVADPVLCRRILWVSSRIAKSHKLPIQFHVGIGDDDVDMPGNDPGHFSEFFAEMQTLGVNVTLLHCYPYVRTAQWLAEVFDNVYYDVGFMLAFGSNDVNRVIREAFEIGPFHKQLYSSDAFALAELYYISATRFRLALATMLQEWVDDNYCCRQDALHIARSVCSENTRRLYNIP